MNTVVFLVSIRDYEESTPIAVYSSRLQALQDLASRGDLGYISELPLNPTSPPSLTWTVFPAANTFCASLTNPDDPIGVRPFLFGDLCATVSAPSKEEAIRLGSAMLKNAT